MTAPQFKVGDRVRFTEQRDDGPPFVSDGTITRVYENNGVPYDVHCDVDDIKRLAYAREVSEIPVPAPARPRKYFIKTGEAYLESVAIDPHRGTGYRVTRERRFAAFLDELPAARAIARLLNAMKPADESTFRVVRAK